MKRISLLIAEDHGVVREGLEMMLGQCPELEIVGAAASGVEALRLVDELTPDVLLLDLELPGMHGLDVIGELRCRDGLHTRILVLTVHDDDDIVLRAVRGGANGYVLKHASRSELRDAIARVAAGGQYFDEVVVRAFLDDDRRGAGIEPSLSEREIEILSLVAEGFTNKQIAAEIYLSADTVKCHLESAYRKLGVSDRAHAVAVALRRGLVL
jgi:DNA-binding NarL/FixJ family response regulator